MSWFARGGGDFVAVDVETANYDRGSICQIGIVEFSNGAISGEFEALVRDPGPFMFQRLHGISSATVQAAPTFPEIFPEVKRRLSGRLAVSHGKFDRQAFAAACSRHQLAALSCRWLDTVDIARQAWPDGPENYKLNTLCELIGHQFRHHDALEDARASGLVLLKACKETARGPQDWLPAATPNSPTLPTDWSKLDAVKIGLLALPLILKGASALKARLSRRKPTLQPCPLCCEDIEPLAAYCPACRTNLPTELWAQGEGR